MFCTMSSYKNTALGCVQYQMLNDKKQVQTTRKSESSSTTFFLVFSFSEEA